MCVSLKIAGVWLPCQLSGRCGGLLDADPAGCLGRDQSWPPCRLLHQHRGAPRPPGAPELSRASTSPPNPSSPQPSPRPSWNSDAKSELRYKELGIKTIERVKKLLRSHTDGDKWNPIKDASFSSILMSRGKEISIANPALSLNEISDPQSEICSFLLEQKVKPQSLSASGGRFVTHQQFQGVVACLAVAAWPQGHLCHPASAGLLPPLRSAACQDF